MTISGYESTPEYRQKQAIYQILLYLLYGLLIVAISGALFVLYRQSERLSAQTIELRKLGELNRANSTLLVECTTPPSERVPPVVIADANAAGDCYLRSGSQTGAAIANVRIISIAAASCGAASPGNVKATEACVNEALKR